MRKYVIAFKRGDLIRLGACGWQYVEKDAYTENGLVFLLVSIVGLKHTQLLVFQPDEAFEHMKGDDNG